MIFENKDTNISKKKQLDEIMNKPCFRVYEVQCRPFIIQGVGSLEGFLSAMNIETKHQGNMSAQQQMLIYLVHVHTVDSRYL